MGAEKNDGNQEKVEEDEKSPTGDIKDENNQEHSKVELEENLK